MAKASRRKDRRVTIRSVLLPALRSLRFISELFVYHHSFLLPFSSYTNTSIPLSLPDTISYSSNNSDYSTTHIHYDLIFDRTKNKGRMNLVLTPEHIPQRLFAKAMLNRRDNLNLEIFWFKPGHRSFREK